MTTHSHTDAIIYLAEQRGCTQSSWQRSYSTFNVASCSHEVKSALGQLKLVNDDTLKGGHTFDYIFDEDTTILLLPVVGGLHYQLGTRSGHAEVGDVEIISLLKGEILAITNPYESELINFICVGWSNSTVASAHYQFDLSPNKNKLITLPSFSIGQFGGRAEGTYRIKDSARGVVAFVLEGAFELQNRLLQPRDGLALWNTSDIEFEALSDGAILLLIESAWNTH